MASTWTDPQFYVVTAAALGGMWLVLRPFLRRSREQKAGCPTCTTCSVTKAGAAKDSGLVTLGSGRS
ncbi:MAG: hypothetical protein KDD47_11375 [Acidobacteria bacterium]|nr:hypothetical protein [Acidobacteriota bacterium]